MPCVARRLQTSLGWTFATGSRRIDHGSGLHNAGWLDFLRDPHSPQCSPSVPGDGMLSASTRTRSASHNSHLREPATNGTYRTTRTYSSDNIQQDCVQGGYASRQDVESASTGSTLPPQNPFPCWQHSSGQPRPLTTISNAMMLHAASTL